jgi:hypothetical protein
MLLLLYNRRKSTLIVWVGGKKLRDFPRRVRPERSQNSLRGLPLYDLSSPEITCQEEFEQDLNPVISLFPAICSLVSAFMI